MAKTATSGQARAFNAMIISRINEEVLEQINGEKFQKAIDDPDMLIYNFIKFINYDCRPMIGCLVANLDYEPNAINSCKIFEHRSCGKIPFQSGEIKLINKVEKNTNISAEEYKKRLDQDKYITVLNANIIDFFETYQYDPEVAKFLKPYRGKDLYQFGTIYQGNNGRKFITKLKWTKKCWCSDTSTEFDNNCILNGLAFVIKK